jgi:hypothetical protein
MHNSIITDPHQPQANDLFVGHCPGINIRTLTTKHFKDVSQVTVLHKLGDEKRR